MRVITIETVRATMKQLGAPSDFGRAARRSRGRWPRCRYGPGRNAATRTAETLPPAPRTLDSRRLRRPGRLLRRRPDDDPPAHAADDPLRRSLDLGLLHPLDRHSRGALTQILVQRQKTIDYGNERQQTVIPLAGPHHRRRMRRTGRILRARRVAGPHRHPSY